MRGWFGKVFIRFSFIPSDINASFRFIANKYIRVLWLVWL